MATDNKRASRDSFLCLLHGGTQQSPCNFLFFIRIWTVTYFYVIPLCLCIKEISGLYFQHFFGATGKHQRFFRGKHLVFQARYPNFRGYSPWKVTVHLHSFFQIAGQLQIAVPHQKKYGRKRCQHHYPRQSQKEQPLVQPHSHQPWLIGPNPHCYQQQHQQQIQHMLTQCPVLLLVISRK